MKEKTQIQKVKQKQRQKALQIFNNDELAGQFLTGFSDGKSKETKNEGRESDQEGSDNSGLVQSDQDKLDEDDA